MLSEGCIVTFTGKSWKVTKGSLIMEKLEKVYTLYSPTINDELSITLASLRSKTKLWHDRLENINKNCV